MSCIEFSGKQNGHGDRFQVRFMLSRPTLKRGPDYMSYKFTVGQAVEYKPTGCGVGFFTVVRQMPEEYGAFDRKYHIKSEYEGFERNVLECDLTATFRSSVEYGDVRRMLTPRR